MLTIGAEIRHVIDFPPAGVLALTAQQRDALKSKGQKAKKARV